MLVVTNCAISYASPIFQSLLEIAGDAKTHNSLNPLPYFPYMHYPGQGKNWGLLKSLSYLQAITLIIYATNLHNCMILSETSMRSSPGDGDRLQTELEQKKNRKIEVTYKLQS